MYLTVSAMAADKAGRKTGLPRHTADTRATFNTDFFQLKEMP
jgi:hypothetical protein